MKKAFSLLELLVVIAIIGVLAGILVASFSGGTESARAAKCLNNMRLLAQAAISYTSTERGEDYPLVAGSHARIEFSRGSGKVYLERPGWISWLSMGDEYGTRSSKKSRPKSFVALPNISAYCEDIKKADFAITNGTLWQAMGGNRECYVCPAHHLAAQKRGARVNFSYVMNCYFGYDSSDGGKAYAKTQGVRITTQAARPDRRILFAELPIYGTGQAIDEGGQPQRAEYPTSEDSTTDCILQYRGYTFNKNWKGTAESIAFNHKSQKRFCAHVVYADGHTEKILKPKSGISAEELTALLCAGKDIGFDGSQYTWVNSTDKNE